MRERDKIKAKFGGKCAYCGEVLPEKGWHIDHKEPVGRRWKTIRPHYKHKITGAKTDSLMEAQADRHNYVFVNSREVPDGFEYPERDCYENKIPSCASCNINKHGQSIEEFRKMITHFIHSLNTHFVQYKIAKRYGLVKEVNKPVVFYFETFINK